MIKIEHLKVYGFESAMMGMRNPMNSWSLSDTQDNNIGAKDLKLLLQLCKAGSDHRKVLRQMFVSFDVVAPLYWWKEFDTYKVGTVSNSCSTMHKLTSRPLTRDDFSFEDFLDNDSIISEVVDNLNARISDYKTSGNKKLWRTIIQLLPCAYNQRRTITCNYENILNMYQQRVSHRLDEWKLYCSFMYKNLPYFNLIVDSLERKA